LEVSSPGINRPLKRPEHFAKFVGKKVRVRTRDHDPGQAVFLGATILRYGADQNFHQPGRQTKYEIPFSMIERSNYEHDWSA
jgi:ribosome maturation factor RimP